MGDPNFKILILELPYIYTPTKGFKGTDKIIANVTNGTYTVQMQYTFVVTTEDNLENYDMKGNKSINTALCNGKDVWKISSIPENTTAEQQVAFENLYINNLINNANKAFGGFSDLTGITLGETTTGEGPIAKITLDTDAAGYGWFIDSTPLINDEFLPTADANIWKAKAGSAAEGKMDMLSVLLA